VDDVERATLALAGSKEPKEHGQLCPVWTQRLKKVRHAATIADCDCWVLPTARLDARIVIAALGSPSTGDAESEEQRRIEQAYIDGSVEGSPIDHDGDLISGEVTRYGAVPAAEPDRPDPWIVVTDDCEACGALVGASHAANCVATEGAVPAADTRKPSDARGSLAGSPLTVKEHARRLAVPPVPQAVPAADDRERPDPVADMETFLGWLFRDGGLEPPRREYDDVQEALAALLWKHGCDHRAGVFPSTGWKPATAKGTAIGEDEWGRPLHVWTGSPSTGDALRAAAQAVVDALPDPIRYAEDGGPIIDTLTVRSPEIVALRAALTRPSTGDDR
jgi:hypothetical protein